AIVDHDSDAPVVGHTVAAVAPAPAAAGEGGFHLELHVVMKTFDLAALAAAAVEHTQIELGEIGHEDVGKIDQDRTLHRVHRNDRHRQQDRVGVILFDRFVDRRATGGSVVGVPAYKLNPVTDAAKDEHHLVVADGNAGGGKAASDRDRHKQGLIE